MSQCLVFKPPSENPFANILWYICLEIFHRLGFFLKKENEISGWQNK